ncbi:hypothetical protein TEA_017194 [Camellia sinensis var. sinensis]|uniref:Inositol polyphosphate-related phosphatase domain-containing protein n=1 Tax=Camellia sinensis var. sinensis TaxID=542762 RepID=A0A4S4ENH8_CAMSN|nr:hypothetical protein TEA_017194 [Camellia sinensis var. sinensis]
MKQSSRRKHHHRQRVLFWSKVMMRKWLNINAKDSDYSADPHDAGSDSDSDSQEFCERDSESGFRSGNKGNPTGNIHFLRMVNLIIVLGKILRCAMYAVSNPITKLHALSRIRRRKSETFRAQYINPKEIKVCVGTWNVGGKFPPDDVDIGSWLDISKPADMYVIGFQEIIPLNAGNVLGAEDSRPVLKWENIIRETLNRIQPVKTKFKCYSDPPSPSRFNPSDDAPDIEDEIVLESDSDGEEEILPSNEESSGFDEVRDGSVTGENVFMNSEASVSSYDAHKGMLLRSDLERQFSSPKRMDKLNFLRTEDCTGNAEASHVQYNSKLMKTLYNSKSMKTLSGTERIGLSWPEPPLDMLARHILDRSNSLKSIKSSKASKSFGKYNSLKFYRTGDNRLRSDAALLAELDLEPHMYQKRRPHFVRIVSKQMVGIFLTIWVRRSFRRHIQNLKVSTVGVGVMGYIGVNICQHVYISDTILLYMHSPNLRRIIWLGDLNYRINLSYEKTRQLISEKDWSKLVESDQLIRELRKGCAFDGWCEGTLNFPPTYKYELNSEKYRGEDPKVGRRVPSWCDRILSFGNGLRLFSYRRAELRLSDHRPVTASYMVEVEVFCPRKLQRALTLTDAEIKNQEVVADNGIDVGLSTEDWESEVKVTYQKGCFVGELKVTGEDAGRHRHGVTVVAVVDGGSGGSENVTTLIDFFQARRLNIPDLVILSGYESAWRSTAFGLYGYLNFTKAGYLEHSKKFNPEDTQTRIEGKNCIVTGANSGIGFATAEGLASRGANVYMVCRNKERGEAARSKIQSTTGNQNVYLEVCDLSSINDIKSFTSRFSSKAVPIHVLVNNAGLLEHNRITTSEGYELNFAVNVLGTYTMTESILPLLEKAAPDARVITVASGGMYTVPLIDDLQFSSGKFDGVEQYARNKRVQIYELNFAVNVLGTYTMTESILPLLEKAAPDARVITVASGGMYTAPLIDDLQFSSGKFDGVEQYARNKRVQVALTEKWAEMYKDKGIGFYSMHPGWAETPGVARSLPGFSKSLSGKLRTSEQGADTVMWLALQPKEKLATGAFYFDRAEAPKHLMFAATSGSHVAIDSILS